VTDPGGIRFGWMQVVLGAALFASAFWLGGPAWLVVWPATSVTAVGLGYLALGPGVFGKRADGTLAPLPTLILFPYHVVAWLRLRLPGQKSRAAWNEVAPGLFLGRRLKDASELPDGTRLVVDLTAEFRASPGIRERCTYRTLPTLDTMAPTVETARPLVEEAANTDGPVYVHCAAGHGRSAAIAAAIVLQRGLAPDAESAIRMLKTARPKVWLHPGQRRLVEAFTPPS
jgi:hypothetical protein